MSRLFAVPDIHGRRDLLDILINKLNGENQLDLTKDKLIFLGDMIDRGPDSKGVMDTIMALQSKFGNDRVIVLAGNHEWLMIDGCISKNYDNFYLWMLNGGDTTQNSFPGGKVTEDYIRWCSSLPLYHEEPRFFFSHAPIPSYNKRMKDAPLPFSKSTLIWSFEDGDEWRWSKHHGNEVVGVCGHIHQLRNKILAPRLYPHYIFADAGAGCSKDAPLVAIEVKSREVIYAWPTDLVTRQ